MRAPRLRRARPAWPRRPTRRPPHAGGGVEAAVGAGDHASRIAQRARRLLDPLRDHLRVLDVVGRRVDHAGHQHPVVGYTELRQRTVLVRVARIRHRQHQPADARAHQRRPQRLERDVAGVRPLVVAPAQVQPHALARNAGERAVQRVDRRLDEVEELGLRAVGEERVALHREVRRVDLQHVPRRHGRLVLGAQRLGDRADVRGERPVVRVRHRAGHDAGRRHRPEGLVKALAARARDRREAREVGVEGVAALVADGADGLRRGHQAHRAAVVRQHQLEEVRMLGEIAHQGPRAPAAEAAHAVADIGEEALARLLAVVADVHAAGELLRDRALGGRAHRSLERRPLDRFAAARAQEELHQRARTREAPGVSRQDARVAAPHFGRAR
jgi:hypothetical protein